MMGMAKFGVMKIVGGYVLIFIAFLLDKLALTLLSNLVGTVGRSLI